MRTAYLILVSALFMSACATASDTSDGDVHAAKFAAPPSNAIREMIRLHVFDTLGADYIADIDTLSRSGKMIARDRGRAIAEGRPIIAPDMEFRLEIIRQDGETICRLVSEADLPNTSDLIFPDDVQCERLPSDL